MIMAAGGTKGEMMMEEEEKEEEEEGHYIVSVIGWRHKLGEGRHDQSNITMMTYNKSPVVSVPCPYLLLIPPPPSLSCYPPSIIHHQWR